jgi:hypothetical protein
MSDPRIPLAALTAAVAAGSMARAIVPARKPLEARHRPYLAVPRARLGTIAPEPVPGSTGLWSPLITSAANGLAKLIDLGATTSIENRLRQAGLADIGVEGHRRRQLGYALGALALGAMAGLILRMSTASVLFLALVAGFAGATRWRGRIDKAIAKRREAMRAELGTVCQLLAIYLRTGETRRERRLISTLRRGSPGRS